MAKNAFTLDDQALFRQLTNLERAQLPFAGARALNDTAADALKHMQDRMEVVFDRPTRWTKNAFMVWRAKTSNLEAQVKERPSMGRRHYLKVQEAGGQRPSTGVEGLLKTHLAYDGIIAAVVPAAKARLDSYGNWSSGERNQVLSALSAQRDRTANTTKASGKRAKARASYFVEGTGIYRRKADGEVNRVLHILDALPSYSPQLGFYEGVAEIWRYRLPVHLDRRLAEAVRTAR
ncbi:hypothetical protein C8J27_106182 [Rhodobacter aestuarii]|uniref:Uncharacterized protein n=1 Tax=Rhodobacter aestuarii TaxID=453582 RepID=A0A1N7M8C2_9RHOB|nr:hypothetical protein [Rhodobacter aestuarii]PTV94913.1 hypothetical protein C8J27_106182 [Rhodobacter aestuarii]SIS82302.1 hypothetical protein SAMN05421580_105182 [Rhodobacter aestuarii]